MMVVYVLNRVFVRIIHALHIKRNSHVMPKRPVQEMEYVIACHSSDHTCLRRIIFSYRYVPIWVYAIAIHHGKEKIVRFRI